MSVAHSSFHSPRSTLPPSKTALSHLTLCSHKWPLEAPEAPTARVSRWVRRLGRRFWGVRATRSQALVEASAGSDAGPQEANSLFIFGFGYSALGLATLIAKKGWSDRLQRQ